MNIVKNSSMEFVCTSIQTSVATAKNIEGMSNKSIAGRTCI